VDARTADQAVRVYIRADCIMQMSAVEDNQSIPGVGPTRSRNAQDRGESALFSERY
jgi:hypothetical protein